MVPRRGRGAPRWILAVSLACSVAVGVVALIRTRHSSPRGTAQVSLRPLGIRGTWHLVLDSEFDGSKLPPDWQLGWLARGVTNPVNPIEEDCYSPHNVTFPGDDTMHLNVSAVPSTCGGVRKPFTGAMVTTDPDDGEGPGFQFTYGVVQVRVYIPADGTQIADWPTVWADGQHWPYDGEADLIEGVNGRACFHFHDALGGPGKCDPQIKPGWHTVAADWQPGSVTYYYDGTKVGSITSGITSAPMFLLLDNTTTRHHPIADSMRVQYVRVWQS